MHNVVTPWRFLPETRSQPSDVRVDLFDVAGQPCVTPLPGFAAARPVRGVAAPSPPHGPPTRPDRASDHEKQDTKEDVSREDPGDTTDRDDRGNEQHEQRHARGDTRRGDCHNPRVGLPR